MSTRVRRAPAVYLRSPEASDRVAFIEAARRSRALHQPWVRAPGDSVAFRAYLHRLRQPGNHGFLVCRRGTDELAGVINLTHVIRGVFLSGYLGYYAFAGHEHQGCMRAGMTALVRHAFGVLKLHRLEANIQPANHASISLVRACGFKQEGYSPRYLKIGGRWRDHERWALLAEKGYRR